MKRPPGASQRVDPREQPGEQLARDVVERVEGDDRVEAAGREVERREVGAEELGFGNRGACPLDLPRRDVDAGHAEPRREPLRVRHAGAAAELEHARAVREARRQLVLPVAPGVADDAVAPCGERLADRVVAVGDDLRSRVRHSTTTRSSRAAASARCSASRFVSATAIT